MRVCFLFQSLLERVARDKVHLDIAWKSDDDEEELPPPVSGIPG